MSRGIVASQPRGGAASNPRRLSCSGSTRAPRPDAAHGSSGRPGTTVGVGPPRMGPLSGRLGPPLGSWGFGEPGDRGRRGGRLRLVLLGLLDLAIAAPLVALGHARSPAGGEAPVCRHRGTSGTTDPRRGRYTDPARRESRISRAFSRGLSRPARCCRRRSQTLPSAAARILSIGRSNHWL